MDMSHALNLTSLLAAAATNLLRETTTDVTWRVPGLMPSGGPVALPRGTEIVVDMIGACRNAHDFAEPDTFQPQRWASSASATDAFIAFSTGPRQCLGRKFSTVEAVCFLSYLLRDWRFDVKLGEGESPEAWQERVMRPVMAITLKIGTWHGFVDDGLVDNTSHREHPVIGHS